jgi:large subunit ribosomal protein L10
MPRTKEKPKTHVSKEKIENVKELVDLFDKNNTIMFASIKGLPAKNFQRIKKDLSKDVTLKVIKKNMLLRAIDNSKKSGIKGLKEYVKEDIAVLLSQSDAFELAGKLAESKTPVKAKVGQIAENDIVIEPGPTELVAGPVVSELGALGLKIEIKAGKIEIKEQKTIVKKGQPISDGATSIMGKFNIMPFSVGFIPTVAYDSKEDKIFTELVIDKEGTLKTIKEYFVKAKAFAVSITYISKETIGFLLGKAERNENALSALIKEDNTPQNVEAIKI